jgi:hypothetical protein
MASSQVAEDFLFLLHDHLNMDLAEVPADYYPWRLMANSKMPALFRVCYLFIIANCPI